MIVGLLLAACVSTSALASPSARAIEAVWQRQTMDFDYRSETQYFSCAEFRTKLSATLRAVGAHRDLTVATLCPPVLSGNIRATITLVSPVEATNANVRSVTTFTPTERLLAHVNGQPLPTAYSLERFPAQWRTVSLTRSRLTNSSGADCEFLRALSKQVLPRLSIRVTRQQTGCVATQIQPRLIVEALLPVEQPTSEVER